MKILSMALRNLGRNRRRSLLAVSSVFFSILLIMVMDGLVNGFMDSLITNYTKNESGHVNVSTAGFREREAFLPVDDYLSDPERMESIIASDPALSGMVRLTEQRIRFGTLLSSGPSTKAAVCIAGDPAKESRLLMLDKVDKRTGVSAIRSPGRYLSGPGEAIIGAGIARDLGLALGGEIKVVSGKSDYGLGFKRFRIVGVFETGVNSLDSSLIQIGLGDAKELLGMDGAQQIMVMLNRPSDAPKAAEAIAAALSAAGYSGLSVRPWTRSGSFADFIGMVGGVYYWIYLFIALLGAFIIANVMMMVVLERKREIGILKSMGMPRREVLALFILEGTLIGLAGSAAGALLGSGLVALIGLPQFGFDMTSAMKGFSWPMDNVIYPNASLAAALGITAMGTVVSMALSFLPSWKAAAMNPVEAIRSV